LNAALVALKPVVENFNKVNNIEISNIVILHDGDSDSCNHVHDGSHLKNFRSSDNVILREPKSKMQIKVDNRDYRGMTASLMEMLQVTTNSKVVGFYITSPKTSAVKNAVYRYYANEKGETLFKDGYVPEHEYQQRQEKASELGKLMRKQKFIESYTLSSHHGTVNGNHPIPLDSELIHDHVGRPLLRSFRTFGIGSSGVMFDNPRWPSYFILQVGCQRTGRCVHLDHFYKHEVIILYM
jgi:hypothetical protein